MPFDLTDAYVALEELNIKIDYIAEQLMEKGIIPRPKVKDDKEKTK